MGSDSAGKGCVLTWGSWGALAFHSARVLPTPPSPGGYETRVGEVRLGEKGVWRLHVPLPGCLYSAPSPETQIQERWFPSCQRALHFDLGDPESAFREAPP